MPPIVSLLPLMALVVLADSAGEIEPVSSGPDGVPGPAVTAAAFYDHLVDGKFTGGMVVLPASSESLAKASPQEAAACWSCTALLETGPVGNRINIVFLGDGFAQEEIGPYYADYVSAAVEFLFSREPFSAYRNYFNVYRVDVISADSGIDQPALGIQNDTALDAYLDAAGMPQLSYAKMNAAASCAPGRDQIIILANTRCSGGYAWANRGALDPSFFAIMTVDRCHTIIPGYRDCRQIVGPTAGHELGHSLGFLGDEYFGTFDTYTATTDSTSPNVSRFAAAEQIAQQVKWFRWIEPACLPSCEPGCAGLLGTCTFEGGGYYAYGLYRPYDNSIMRHHLLVPWFGAVHIEQLVIRIHDKVSPIDSVTPSAPRPLASSTVFEVSPMRPLDHELNIQWVLDGSPVAGAQGRSFCADSPELTPGLHEVQLIVQDNTPWVRDPAARLRSLTATRSWRVVADCNGNTAADASDIAGGSSRDLDENGLPDECEDCNGNGAPDRLDISSGLSLDCDANLLPDECQKRRLVGFGKGPNHRVRALALYDCGAGPELYIGGDFSQVDGVTTGGIARWDGRGWQSTGQSGSTMAFAVFDLDGTGAGRPALCAIGSSGRVSAWDGARWTQVGETFNKPGWSLTVYDDGTGPALYAGGDFTRSGSTVLSRLARWDGHHWTDPQSPFTTSVRALAVHDDGTGPSLFAGNKFYPDGSPTFGVGRWNGAVWTSVGSPSESSLTALRGFDFGLGPMLIRTLIMSPTDPSFSSIERWTGSEWIEVGRTYEPDIRDVFSLPLGEEGGLFAVGGFILDGATGSGWLVRWDGTRWQRVSRGIVGMVMSSVVSEDGEVYMGGEFTVSGCIHTRHLVSWSSPPRMVRAVSRRVHSGAGACDVGLPIGSAGALISEWRAPGPLELILSFDQHVYAADGVIDASEAAVTAGVVNQVSREGKTLKIQVSDLPDGACFTVFLTGLRNLAGLDLEPETASVRLRMQAGDVNSDGAVTAEDVHAVKTRCGQMPAAGDPALDLTLDGEVDCADVIRTKSLAQQAALRPQ